MVKICRNILELICVLKITKRDCSCNPSSCKFLIMRVSLLKIYCQADVELATGEVVGDGILDVVYVGNPIVGGDVCNVEEVEHVHAEPYALEVAAESAAALALFERGEQGIGETDVHTLVGGHTEEGYVA